MKCPNGCKCDYDPEKSTMQRFSVYEQHVPDDCPFDSVDCDTPVRAYWYCNECGETVDEAIAD